VIEKVGAGDGI